MSALRTRTSGATTALAPFSSLTSNPTPKLAIRGGAEASPIIRRNRVIRRNRDGGKTRHGARFGIREVDHGIWLTSFMHYDLGYFHLQQKTLQPLDSPFGMRLSPTS